MFKMSDLSIELYSSEKLYPFSFKGYFPRLSRNKFIRYASWTKLSWKVNIFINRFKLLDCFYINKQITIIMIVI